MIIFLCFVAVFLSGFVLQFTTKKWQLSVGIPTISFILYVGISALSSPTTPDTAQETQLLFFFGTPMVFFASLLGVYIHQIRFSE
ncbi:MAG: hypothetical protein ACRBHB_22350 [Arenicella sp.]